jgi:hypothetical protein
VKEPRSISTRRVYCDVEVSPLFERCLGDEKAENLTEVISEKLGPTS